MRGILVVDKPSGWTSFDVIAKLRGALGTRKLGHSGTLDPMATGVLPVFVGAASKAVDLQENHDKTYRAAVRFGLATDTGDITGNPVRRKECTVTRQELEAVLPSFLGEQSQVPPMYSAVKVGGVPLYKLARQGKEVERKARTIRVYSLTCLEELGPNEFLLEAACSKGTYIRTLLEDIGAALDCPATMTALRRTAAGVYTQDQAHPLEEILALAGQGRAEELLLDLETVFAHLPLLKVNPGVEAHLRNGCPTSHYKAQDGRYRVQDQEGNFLGTARVTGGVLNVEKLFVERA